jgi:hypothetical protein
LPAEKAKEISEKRTSKIKGKQGWSSGLTKETSSSLQKAAQTRSKTVKAQFASGERIPWNKGLTKETNKSVSSASEKLSNQYRSGALIPWALGLTKASSEKVLKMSQSVSIALKNKELRNRLDALKRLSTEEIIKRLNKNSPDLLLITDLSSYTRDRHVNLEFECKKCNHIQTRSFLSALSNRCDKCDPGSSKQQLEVDRFVASLGVSTSLCDRSIIAPYEIDIYVPSRSFGIEFNGLYFHSEVFKNRNYHSDKTHMCAERGVQLFHLFEDEWCNKKEICQSMIMHKLGLTTTRVYARKCKIELVTARQKKEFFCNNHIDGNTNSRINFGLISEDGDIVACLSLRKPTHKKYKNMLEVARFCTKIFTHIPGGLSKLTTFALNYCHDSGYTNLLTYVDTRHGTKNGYLSAGYDLVGATGNRFWWTAGKERIDRFKIRADKELGLTEKEVAFEHGVVKIWGCPNLIFEYNKKKEP